MTAPLVAGALVGLAVLTGPSRRWPPTRRVIRRPSRTGRWWACRIATSGVQRPPGDDLLEVLDMVGAQVRAGAEPAAAWAAAVDVAEVHLPGSDPVAALELLASASQRGRTRRSSAALVTAAASAAAAWSLAERTGAPLADLLDSVCASVRADRADQAFLEAATAGPQATARLLLALPVAGVALGQLVGAEPLDVLATTGAGRACAALGVGLLLLGRTWMARLVRSVEAAGRPAGAGATS